MNSDRETIEYTASNGKILVLKSYITAREKREIDTALVKSFNENDKYLAVIESQNATLKNVIVSYDGKKDGVDGFNIIETLLDLKSSIFNEIKAKIDEVLSTVDEKKTI